MSLPGKNQQVAQVMRFLDSERNEGRDLKVIATEIVDGFHEMLLRAVKKPATPLRVGMLIKSPYDAKVRRVAWLDDAAGKVWIVHETSSYGWLGPSLPATSDIGKAESGKPSGFTGTAWEYCEEFRPKRRIEVDGKGKMAEMTDDEITEAWSNPDWKVGDRLSQHQREFVYEVIATGPQCVLMRDVKTGVLNVDSNKSLERYYKREVISEW